MSNVEILEEIGKIHVYKSKLGKYIERHYPDLWKEIINNTKFLNNSASFQERFYCIKNNLSAIPLCPVCHKNPLKFNTDCGSYRSTCSTDCSIHDKDRLKKVKNTKKRRYGDKNYEAIEKNKATRFKHFGSYHSKDFGEKVKKTKLLRYGDENYTNIEKTKQTNMSRYGVDFYQKTEECKQKQKHTMLDRYGVNNGGELEYCKERGRIGNRKRSYNHLMSMLSIFDVSPTFDEKYFIEHTANEEYEFQCNHCGTIFTTMYDNGYLVHRCPKCYKRHGTSNEEQEVYKFISQFGVSVISGTKKILSGQRQLDIYIPDKKLAIEFDGLYWHSEKAGTDSKYHLSKTEECEKHGIQLIHIFEDEWLCKQDIVKSRLKNLLGIYDNICYARQCVVKEFDSSTSKDFQETNHIQGSANSKVNLGLFYKDELVSLMTFSKPRFDKKHEWELVRFCNKLGWHIPGAASKLLTYFERNWSPKNIVSYADRRWSIGNLYEKLGFMLDHVSNPNYWYVNSKSGIIRESRIKFQKHKLETILEKFDPSLTEAQNMENNGYFKIWDCGNLVFVKNYV